MFQGQAPPFSTNSRLPTSPAGVVLPPSGGWRMNFLFKTSQGGISKLITWSLFFKINRFFHIAISFLFDTVLNNFGTGHELNPVPKLLRSVSNKNEMTMWENLLTLKNKDQVMNF